MGVRVEVREGESVLQAMRRLKRLRRYQLGRVVDQQIDHFIPQPVIRRKKEWRKLVLSSRETYYAKRRGLQ